MQLCYPPTRLHGYYTEHDNMKNYTNHKQINETKKKHIWLQKNIPQTDLHIVIEWNKYILNKERSSARVLVNCVKDTQKNK